MSPRTTIKKAIKQGFLILALPLFGLFLLIRAITSSDNSFASFSQLLSLIPGKVGVYFRAAFYHLACPGTSQNISVGFLTLLSHRNTTMKEGVYIGPQSNIGSCYIGRNTLIGSGVHILSGKNQHHFSDLELPIQEQQGEIKKIKIGEDCWIGNQSTILAPVSNGSIVAASSLVLVEVGPNIISGGHPAKFIKSRYKQTRSQ